MDDFLPWAMFGIWVVLVFILILVSGRALGRAVRERLAVYGKPHDWRETSALEYPRLKHDFYDDCQAALEQAGYKAIGDIEDVTLTETRENPHTFRRVMLSKDGRTVAEFWQVNFSPWKQLFRMATKGLGDARFIRLFSEAEDGRLFAVMRAPEKMRQLEPPQFEIRYADGKQTADEIWARYEGEFPAYLQTHADFKPRGFKFIDDVIASEKRQQELRVANRRVVGLLTREELLREGMAEKNVDSYLRAFTKRLRKTGEWPPTS